MPRRKTIYVDPMAVLANIAACTDATLADLRREEKRAAARYEKDRSYQNSRNRYEIELTIEGIIDDGVLYHVPAFLGYEPTPTQRLYCQKAIRDLSDRGLVELYGDKATRVRILPAGRRALEAKPEPAIAAEPTQ